MKLPELKIGNKIAKVPIIQAAPVYLQHYSEDTCPQCADYTGDKGYKLDDVKRGIVSMDEFLAQLAPTRPRLPRSSTTA